MLNDNQNQSGEMLQKMIDRQNKKTKKKASNKNQTPIPQRTAPGSSGNQLPTETSIQDIDYGEHLGFKNSIQDINQ